MLNCCGFDAKSLRDQIEFDTQETKDGIQVNIRAKDPSKTESLKAMFKACRDFGTCC